ncbi:MAG: hypothetical protein IT372_42650 [Polyangiaceae bacterium]|nr:hypothetical protein [Polyangiaceae bacterium]
MEFVINLKDLVSPVVAKTTERVKDFKAAAKDAGLELAKLGGGVGAGLAKTLMAPIGAAGKGLGGMAGRLAVPFLGAAKKVAAPFAPAAEKIRGIFGKLGLGEQAKKAGTALAGYAKAGALVAAAGVLALAKASAGAAVGVVAFGLKAALAFRGMGQFQSQLGRFQLNLRRLFHGVDTQPLIRSMQRAADFFDRSRASGKMMSEILTSGLNLVARVLEKLVPLGEEFVWGLIAGFHYVRGAAYAVGATLLSLAGPATKWALDATKGVNLARGAVAAGIGTFVILAAVMGVMAVSALLVTLPMVALAGAVIYVGAKFYKLIDALGLAKPLLYVLGAAAIVAAAPFLLTAAAVGALAWGSGWVIDKIVAGVQAFKSWIGVGGEVATATNGMGDAVASLVARFPGGDKANESGKAIGDGLVKGLQAKIPDVTAAGAQLANAADAGVRSAAQIRSPARRFVRNAKYMGEGLEIGLEESGPGIQAAAEENLVPRVPSPFGGDTLRGAAPAGAGGPARVAGGAGGLGGRLIHIENLHVNGKPGSAEMRRAHEEWLTDVAVQMGLTGR